MSTVHSIIRRVTTAIGSHYSFAWNVQWLSASSGLKTRLPTWLHGLKWFVSPAPHCLLTSGLSHTSFLGLEYSQPQALLCMQGCIPLSVLDFLQGSAHGSPRQTSLPECPVRSIIPSAHGVPKRLLSSRYTALALSWYWGGGGTGTLALTHWPVCSWPVLPFKPRRARVPRGSCPQ